MGMSIFFEGDEQISKVYECTCVWNSSPTPECSDCKGCGVVVFTNDAHSMHVGYATAFAIFERVGHTVPEDTYATTIPVSWNLITRINDAIAITPPANEYGSLRSPLYAFKDVVLAALAKGATEIHAG
jgi:hypothetical protein